MPEIEDREVHWEKQQLDMEVSIRPWIDKPLSTKTLGELLNVPAENFTILGGGKLGELTLYNSSNWKTDKITFAEKWTFREENWKVSEFSFKGLFKYFIWCIVVFSKSLIRLFYCIRIFIKNSSNRCETKRKMYMPPLILKYYHNKGMDKLAQSHVELTDLVSPAKPSSIAAREILFIHETVSEKAPVRRTPNTMNTKSAVAAPLNEIPSLCQQLDPERISKLRKSQLTVHFLTANNYRLFVLANKIKKLQNDILSLHIGLFGDHPVLVFDSTSMQDATEKISILRYNGRNFNSGAQFYLCSPTSFWTHWSRRSHVFSCSWLVWCCWRRSFN